MSREVGGFIASDVREKAFVDKLNMLFTGGIAVGASDIHIEDAEHDIRVRYRIDGKLEEVDRLDRRLSKDIDQKIRLKASIPLSERSGPADGKIHFEYEGRRIDVRVSLLPTTFGQSIVCRLLDSSDTFRKLESMRMRDDVRQSLRNIIEGDHGLFLMTGPTGSGKTSTLYACLNYLNTAERKINTAEDPVEYTLAGIQQTPVAPGRSFSKILRSMLRQDPDVILIGEIRDAETAEIAIQAANTGHIVLSTLHTNDAPSTIRRLLDLGIDHFSLSAALKGVIAQRLFPALCECHTMKLPNPAQRHLLESYGFPFDIEYGMRGEGCQACSFIGEKGRVPVMEMMLMSKDLREALKSDDEATVRRAVEKQAQHESLLQCAIRLSSQGLISLDKALAMRADSSI